MWLRVADGGCRAVSIGAGLFRFISTSIDLSRAFRWRNALATLQNRYASAWRFCSVAKPVTPVQEAFAALQSLRAVVREALAALQSLRAVVHEALAALQSLRALVQEAFATLQSRFQPFGSTSSMAVHSSGRNSTKEASEVSV